MDPISRLNRMMETLRKQMAESSKRLDTSKSPPPEVCGRSRYERPTIQALKARIEERIGAIESDAPDRDRRAQRIFLESVIAWEFGDQLLLDSQVGRLVDGIQETFETDPELNSQFHDLLSQLSHGQG